MSKVLNLMADGKIQEAIDTFTDRHFGIKEKPEADFEITVSRNLIATFKSWLVDQKCECNAHNTPLCERCNLLNHIDSEMRTIGKHKSGS